MLSSRPRIFRPAIFSCGVTGCSRAFKSEPGLKRHQTSVHVVPDALRPQRVPRTSANNTQHETPLEDSDAQTDEVPLHNPRDSYIYDGLDSETHPILDGECKSSRLLVPNIDNGVLRVQEHHVTLTETTLNLARYHRHSTTALKMTTRRLLAVRSSSSQNFCTSRMRCQREKLTSSSTCWPRSILGSPRSCLIKSCTR